MGNLVNKNIDEITGECSFQDLGNNKFYVTMDLHHYVQIRKISWTGWKSGKSMERSRSGASYDRRHLSDLQHLEAELENIPATVKGQPETLMYVKQQVQHCLKLPESERLNFVLPQVISV